MKTCTHCNAAFEPTGNYQLFCLLCGEEKRKERFRRHYAKNRERRIAETRAWQAANPEQALAIKRAYYRNNTQAALANSKAWRAKNAERFRETCKAWAKANPQKMKDSMRRVNHNRRKAPGKISRAEISAIMADPCAYCGAPAEHLDHCTPLSRGGWNSADNCVSACASCNLRKGSQTVLEFLGLWPKVA